MAVNNKVDVFTTTMRTEFQVAYQATAEPAPWEKFTQAIPSSARIEHYTWMSPSPGLNLYAGHRRFGSIDTVRYSVENKEFDASFQVLRRDIEDDQTGGYMLKPKELAERAKKFPGRWVIKHLSNAEGRTCFDGTNMAANSHVIGTGDNLLAKDCASNDGLTYNIAALFTGGTLKPLLWQNRKPPEFKTDAGSPTSDMAKIVHYWIDMEGEAAYGYWWDLVWVNVTDTPNVTEMHEIFSSIEAAFRTFTLPKSLASEDGEYIHEQVEFSASNLTLVASTGLAELLRQSLNQDWVPQSVASTVVPTTNRFKGWASYVVSAFMN